MNTSRKSDGTELPDGWRLMRLGDVAEVVTGSTPPRKVSEYYGGNVPWIKPSDLASARIVDSSEEYLTSAGVAASRQVPELSVLVSCIGTIGEVGISRVPLCFNQQINALIPCSEVLPAFLYWACNQQANYLISIAAKTAVPILNKTAFSNVSILLPPLPEQRAIADVLDSIDEVIEHTEVVIAATETLRDSLLHELLTRGVPGWHTEWKDVPGIGTIPADWEVVRLGDGVVHVGSGVTPRGGKSVYTPSGITFLRSQNVHFDGLRLEDVVRIPPETDKAMARSRVQPNDVLLNITGASIGRCTVVPSDFGPANVNQHVCIIRTSDQFNPRYVWKWLSTPRSQKEIDDIQTGQSRQGLNYQQVRQLSIALPPRSEQDAFVEILSGLDATIAEAKREQDGLRSLKESTADALLTGEARINN